MTDFTPENLTDDQIITLLQMLFVNMNNLDRVYYDLFINTVPLDVTLERYDENGTLQKYTIPNRAKDKAQTYVGQGNPEGVQDGKIGSFYLDVLSSNLYVKIRQTERYGWFLLYTANNFKAGTDYLAPNGDGSGLTSLNMNNAGNGILSPIYGGTGTNGITGLLKGNGVAPMSVAVAGTDYLSPDGFTGMIGIFAGIEAPTGWLIADGSLKTKTAYARLYNVIGDIYADGTEPSGYFRLPDLRGVFIRGYDDGTRGLDSTTFDATLTANSNFVQDLPSGITESIKIGSVITGDGIPNGTTVTAITSSTLTMSNNANLSGAKSLTVVGRKFGSYQPDSSVASGGATLNVSYRNYDGYPSSGEAVRAVANVSLTAGQGLSGDNHPKNISLLTCIKY